MTGAAALLVLAAMAGSWLFRSLLLRTLRNSHPGEFAELGQPSSRQLASLLPRNRELQLRFWTSLWSGRFFLIGDKRVSGLAWGALIADAVLVVGIAGFFWSAAK